MTESAPSSWFYGWSSMKVYKTEPSNDAFVIVFAAKEREFVFWNMGKKEK